MATRRKIAILKDRSTPMFGLHGLHVAFRGLPNVEVVALADSNLDRIDEVMALTQAKRHYRDYLQMLDREQPDLVVLCSRHPDDHLPQIAAAAERGIHIYCEKPIAATLPEADRIIALAERHGVTVGMAHLSRYDLGFRTLRAMVAAGAIGIPIAIHGRGKCDYRGGAEDLVVLGTHILDLQTFIFGPPISVSGHITRNGRLIEAGDRCETKEPIGPAAGDHVVADFQFADGVRGSFESQRDVATRPDGRTHMGITVVGSEGSLAMRFTDRAEPTEQLRMCRRPGAIEDDDYMVVPLTETRSIPGAEPVDYSLAGRPDVPSARWFLDANRFAAWDLMCAIDERRQPVASICDARLVLEMIQGIYASHLKQRPVAIPLQDRTPPLSR